MIQSSPGNLQSAIVRNPLVVSPNTPVIDAIAQMGNTQTSCASDRSTYGQLDDLHTGARSSCVVVVDGKQVVGILTERDVVRLSAQQRSLPGLLVGEVMATPVMTMRQSALTDLFAAINLLQQYRIRHLPILDEQDHLIGIATHESLRQLSQPIALLRLRTVSEIMVHRVVWATPDVSVLEVAQKMFQERVSSVVIVESKNQPDVSISYLSRSLIPLGILTERDLVQFQALGLSLQDYKAGEVMSSPVFTVQPHDSLLAVQQLMERHFISRIVVTGEQAELVGIITQTSLLQALNPLEIYKLAEALETKVMRLEAEKLALLESRATALESEVNLRTRVLETKAKQEALLLAIATQLRSSLDLQTILETAVDQIRQVIGCDRVNIWQFEPDWSSVVVAEATTSSLSLLGEQVQDVCYQSRLLEVYREGHVRVVPDIYTTEMTDCHRELLIRLHTRAKVLLPLFCGDRLWGLLNVSESQIPRDWQADEIDFLRAISTHLAIAIQQASTHDELRQSEERLQQAQRIAHLGNWELDLQHNTLYWSEEIFQIFEIDPQQFDASYEAFLALVHPEDRDKVNAAYRQHLGDRQPYSLVHRLQLPDGRIKYVQEQCETTYLADGTPQISRGTVQDITSEKEAELSRDRAEAALRQVVEGTAAVTGDQFFPNLVRHLSEALQVRYALVAEQVGDRLHSLAFCDGGVLQPTISYCIAHTPCENALRDGEYYCSHAVQMVFPDDPDLVTMAAESYLGIALKNDRGEAIGDLCVLDTKPMLPEQIATARQIMQIFAARASAELQRKRLLAQLCQLNQELEVRVLESTDDLQEREAQLSDLFDNATDLIQSVAPDGRILFVNRAWRETLGYDAAELENLTIFDIIHPDDRPHCQQAMQSLFSGSSCLGIEVRFLTKNGQEIVVEGNVNCHIQDGQPISTRGIFRDITDRKQAEKALYESQQLLKTVLDTVPLSVFWKDRSSHYLGANSRFLQDAALGSVSELVGKNDFEMPWGTIEAEAYRADDRIVMDSGEAKLGIIETQHQQGGMERWLETNKLPLRNLAGDVIGVLGTYQDITERRDAELALKRQLAAIEAAVDGIAILQNEQYVYLNSSHIELFGYRSTKELIGKSWRVLYAPRELERFDREIWPALYEQMCWQGEVLAMRKDGTTFPQQLSLTLTADNLLICVCQDISDRKAAETLIRQQADRETLLREITQRIRQSLDLQTTFDTACQEIRLVLQADRVGIFKFYPDSNYDDGEFVAEALAEGIVSVKAIRVHDHCFGDQYAPLYLQGRYAAIEDIDQLQSRCHADVLAQFQVRASLIMPLLSGDCLWGLLCIHQCAGTRQWQAFEVDLTQQLASQLAIAIQQASLYDRVQTELQERQQAETKLALQLQRQQALATITQLILQRSLNLEHILTTAVQQVQEVLKGDRVIIFRLYADGRSQIVEEAVSEGLPRLQGQHWDDEVWSQNILDCYWQGQPRIVPDVMVDRWTDCLVEYSIEGQIQSKIVAPILQEIRPQENHRWVSPYAGNKLWGVLVVHACTEKRAWLETEAQLLQQIANQVAIAIQQASLFEQLQQELTDRQQAQTQLAERNQQLAIANQELARATRLKDEFLASMSHELRTPLNSILGMTEALQEEVYGTINERQEQALKTVFRSGSHLLELINDILDLAKIESGQVDLEYSPTSIPELCQASVTFIQQQAHKKNIQLQVQVPASLPELMLDKRRIRQVLINLLNNAVKFTPSGGSITLQVTIKMQVEPEPQERVLASSRSRHGRNWIQFAVIDTGIGISQENIQKLFQPFIQLDSALNRQYAGTGLGLSLVKRIVELHGGQVGVSSREGQGSCFWFTLPGGDRLLPSAEPESSSSLDVPAPEPVKTDRRILLAEDNLANIQTIAGYLEIKGYTILQAHNGQEAIEQAQSQHPDLILMDIQMPVMDGLEAIRRIRQNPDLEKIPIIALTALAMPGDQDECLAAGATSYLSKPVRLKQLLTTIQNLL